MGLIKVLRGFESDECSCIVLCCVVFCFVFCMCNVKSKTDVLPSFIFFIRLPSTPSNCVT